MVDDYTEDIFLRRGSLFIYILKLLGFLLMLSVYVPSHTWEDISEQSIKPH